VEKLWETAVGGGGGWKKGDVECMVGPDAGLRDMDLSVIAA